MEKLLHFKDIGLVPRQSQLLSRSEADTRVDFCCHKFLLPVIPSNMASVINFELAEKLSKVGYFYVLHRFYDYNDIFNWIKEKQDHILISIAVGVKGIDRDLIDKIASKNLNVDFVTVDVSHGFAHSVRLMINYIKDKLPKTKIIAGNVWGDKDSIEFLANAGVDAIKVGLSYGSGCTTYNKTAFCSPMFSCGLEARKHTNLPLIADGSCSNNGDIIKVIRAGYTMAMIGGMFAACTDSPAQFVNGKKLYYGSASSKNKGHFNHVEGREVLMDCNGMTVFDKMNEIKQDLSSAISYSGGKNLAALKDVEYFII